MDGTAASSEGDRLRAEADRLKREGALGRSDRLLGLFDYLLERTLAGRSPKEVEVAMDVFGRPADFEPGRDAVVRVYAHKLRQRLQAAYANRPDVPGDRLALPRGEYRLLLERSGQAAPAEPRAGVGAVGRAWRPAVLAAAALIVAALSSLLTAGVIGLRTPVAARELDRVRQGPLWAPLLRNRRPTVIALGDYYIFGESRDGMEVNRLVREYSINSREELDEYLMTHPEKSDHYLDLDLRYLPIGAGAAVRRIAPVLAGAERGDDVRVVLMSDLTPAMLRNDNVVYVGYFSGMGWLRDLALARSRFSIGETFDDLVDRRSPARFASQGGPSDEDRGLYRDYGYVSTFAGPDGGRVVVVAGTRDAGLMQAGEEATRPGPVGDAARLAGAGPDREALYEVKSMHRANVGARLVSASRLDLRGGGEPVPAPPG